MVAAVVDSLAEDSLVEDSLAVGSPVEDSPDHMPEEDRMAVALGCTWGPWLLLRRSM